MGSPLSKDSKARRWVEDPKSHAKPAADGGTTSNEFGVPYRDLEAKNDRLSFPLDKLHLSSISDQQLALLFSTAPKLHEYGGVTVVRLSKSLACKGGRGVFPSESQNMIFAAETLGLPVPRVHRTFTADVPGTEEGQLMEAQFIVMDYIPGPTVKECWDSLKVDQRQSVASQVASMIEKMQSTALELPPGPVGWTGSQKFVGP
ncbi:C6 zinc finger domain protein [Phlyctema vagabunda]|uniref:C6 zinc finger domain protein n=1 Tax=Phlyctema vagabunda TaxID=108571 RepID=A0ABR4PYD1_9HELO